MRAFCARTFSPTLRNFSFKIASSSISIIGKMSAKTTAKITCNATRVRYFQRSPRNHSVSADMTAAIMRNIADESCEGNELKVNMVATSTSPVFMILDGWKNEGTEEACKTQNSIHSLSNTLTNPKGKAPGNVRKRASIEHENQAKGNGQW